MTHEAGKKIIRELEMAGHKITPPPGMFVCGGGSCVCKECEPEYGHLDGVDT
jgi:hypothetical protein